MRETLTAFCRRTGREALLDHWCGEKNLPLTPETVSCGSSRKVWWSCEKGHTWQADVFSRAKGGTGCPYCAGKRPVPGQTDLAARFPELAAEWDSARNAPLTPEPVLPGSHRQGVGRALFAALRDHARRTGCEYLQGKTVAEGHYPQYDRTNAFYRAMGFRELEVLPLWDAHNPCQLYVMRI